MSNKAYAQYSISDIRDGKDGVGILELEEQYYKSTSNSSQTGGNWSSTQPTWEDGYYIWTRLKITWDNDVSDPEHITYTDPVLATTYQSLHTDVINRINNIATKDENGNWSLTNGVIENTYVYSSEDGDPIALGEIGANITTTKDQILSTVSSTYATTANLNSEINKRKATYVTCSTGAGTKAKIGSCSNFELYNGATITCVFSDANTQAAPTLNVNGTGAKTIVSYDGKALTESEYKWKAGSAYTLVYDGTNWRMQDSGTVARLTTAESSITQNANNIALKVSESDVTGNYLIGKINLDSTTATISASRVNITGDVIVSKLSDDNKNTISANAISKAEEAIGKAEDAQSDASDAVSTANSANSTAQSANTNASNALSKANSSIKTDTLHYLATSASSGVTKSTSGWTTTVQSVDSTKRYLWTYHTYTKADNTTSDTNPVITGVYGDPGTSVTVSSTSVTYQKGTSGTEKPTGTWGTSIPTVGENEFLWTKTVVNYSDGKSTEAYSVSRNAKNGTNGTSPTVTSTKTQYQQSTSGTTTPTGTWLDTPPTATLGQYMWTKTTVTYSDSKTAVSYTVSRNGEKGDTGVGIKSVTPLYYGTNSTTAPAKPTSTVTVSSSTTYNKWNKTCPTWTTTYKYYFTCSEILYDDNTTRTWSDVVRENALETANSTANNASTNASNALSKAGTAETNASNALGKANTSIVEQKTLYYLTNGNAPAKPTSAVTSVSTSTGVWTTVIPDPKNGYTYYTCTQTKNGAGTYAWIGDSNNKGIKMATDSMIANWCSASDSTYINGGSIYANSITTNQLATDAIKSINYEAASSSTSPYSVNGTFLDLSTGNIYTPNFGVQSTTGKAYLNGEIIATSGTIGDDSGNYWEIGNTTDTDGGTSASIVGNGTAYIQDGDFQIHNGASNYSKGSINTQWYATVSGGLKITYPFYANTYYDFGMTSPVLDTTDTSRFYNETVSQNFLYIRKHASTIPTLASDWNYVFRVDKDGNAYVNNLYVNGTSIATMISDGVDGGAYLPTSGGTVSGNVTITGTLTATASKAIGDKNGSDITTTYHKLAGSNTNTATNTFSGANTFSKTGGFIYSGIENGTSAGNRPVWFSYLGTTGRPVYNNNFQYNPSTNVLTVGSITGNAATATSATKATQDASGNVITETYAKINDTSLTGTTIAESINSDEVIAGSLIVNGDARFVNTINGDITGNAASSDKLNTNAGSGTQPVYFANGVPVATTYALNKTVPADAKFTDTTYTPASSVTAVSTTAVVGTSANYARQDHVHNISLATGDSNGQVKIAGSNVSVKGLAALAYKASLGASDVGLGNVTNNKQVKGLSSGTTSGHLVTWGSDGYTVADSGIAKGSVTTKITLSGTDYSASSNTITITKENLQDAVQDTSYVLMTSEERSKLSSIAVSSGGTIDFSGVTASAPLTATVNQTTKAVNLTHNTSGVTAGTYKSVTVNTYGHVTGGTNPTTLSGYGITDAKIASGTITLGSNTITPLTSSSTLSGSKVSGAVAEATKATQDGNGKNINDTYLKKAGDIMSGDLNLQGSTNDSPDIVWKYSDGTEKMRIWTANEPTTKIGPNFRVYKADGTSLYSGTLVLADGTGASGTWGISISGNAATATTATTAGNVTGTVAVGNGGTGKTSWTQWGIVYASATNALSQIGAGTSGQVLTSKGSAAPAWTNQSALSVGSATKATNDSDNNPINTTYLKLAGGTMTGLLNFTTNAQAISFRPGSTSYDSGFVYGTDGNECLALVQQNQITSFMVVHGSDPASWGSGTWKSSTPTIQTKYKSLYVNELIANGVTPEFNFKVNGTSYLGGNVKISHNNSDTEGAVLSYNSTNKCIDFIFN